MDDITQTIICGQLFAGHVGLSTNEMEEKFSTSDNLKYHSKQIFLSFHWPTAHHVTCK